MSSFVRSGNDTTTRTHPQARSAITAIVRHSNALSDVLHICRSILGSSRALTTLVSYILEDSEGFTTNPKNLDNSFSNKRGCDQSGPCIVPVADKRWGARRTGVILLTNHNKI